MYHAIIGVDEDEQRAMACAEAVGALPGDVSEVEVTIVYSFTENPSGASATQVHSVREVEDYFDDEGIEYRVADTSGDPADRLLETAADNDADLIVVAGRKRSPAGKALFGSVTQEVILNADRPVMVAGKQKLDEN